MFTQQHLTSILSSLPDPAFILTRSGRYAAVFGGKDLRHYHDGSHLVGRSMFEVLKEEKARWFTTQIEEALESGALHIVEYELGGRDVKGAGDGPDHSIWFEGRVQALDFLVEGEQAVVWVASNITDKNATQQKLRQLSETDALTGLYNRRYFDRHLGVMLGKAQSQERDMALMILDIDHFKAVNDTHGHDIGDAVLKEFAARLRRNIRGVDLACRFGGEEFVVLMPDTDYGQAQLVAERVRQSIAERPFEVNAGRPLSVTVSAGVTLNESDADTPETLIKRADVALYRAKREGRNRVVFDAA